MDLQLSGGELETQIRELEGQRDLAAQILDTVNLSDEKIDIIRKILLMIKKHGDFKAVGIRLMNGNDFPYYVTDGFSEDFIEAENHLCARDQNGEPKKGADGNPYLECMCGNVLCGRVNSELPFFTDCGSFWTNSTTELLASTTEKDRQAHTRNRCNSEGYESVALIPLRGSDHTIGLLQLNDYRKGKFTKDKITYFEKIGASIGVGLKRKQAVEIIRQANEKLEQKVRERTIELSNSNILLEQKIRERKQIEKSLRESEKRYRSLISKMGNSFALNEIIFDKDRKPIDSRFLEVNPAFEEMTGLDKKDLLGKKVGDVFPGTEPFWVDKCGQIALNGRAVQFKNCSRLFNRHFEIIAYSPEKGQVAAVFTNITDRIEIEEALRESENNFRSVAENANDGILIAVGEGLYVYVNHRAKELTEYSINELKNMSFKDLVHPDQVERIGKIYQRRIMGKSVPACYETLMIKKSGGLIPIEVTGSKTIWHGKAAVMIIIRDISMRKRLEAALGKINNDLEQRVTERTQELMDVAEKLEEKQKDLLCHKLDLEKANKELVQTNTALSVLARNIDKKRDDVEKKIAHTISSQILPVVDEIKNDKMAEKTRAKMDVLSAYLSDLTPEAAKSHDIIISLSPMELRVAMMIKNGFSSEEIARLLHISPHTVKTHRRSIRKKLNIKNANINLSSYLKLKLGRASYNSNPNI
jgi:PAS domain S-box-containing protein